MKGFAARAVAKAGLAAWIWFAATAAPAHGAEALSFVSGGKSIRVDVYEPASAGCHPSALVLHGAGGLLFDGPEMRRMARQLAANGVRAYVIHYFDGSGVVFTTSDRVLREHYGEWLAVVRGAVDFVQQRQGAPARPVAIYGYSMGAFLGIAASSDNPKVGALAEQAGGVWDGRPDRVGRMPPVLMIHGRADRRVPFEKYALPLEKVLALRGTGCETWFVPSEGHGFSPRAQAEARGVVMKFFLAVSQPKTRRDSTKTRPSWRSKNDS